MTLHLASGDSDSPPASASFRDEEARSQPREKIAFAATKGRSQALWAATFREFGQPNPARSILQLTTTFLPLAALYAVMYLTSFWSTWVTLLLAVPTAGMMIRLFIIQHDCGHHSYFRSKKANDWLGAFCGIFTLTPYHYWRRTHSRHHATSGNLHHRGHGDVLTLSVTEYNARTPLGKLAYRIYRHPLVMFGLGASFMFIIQQRFTMGIPLGWKRERDSIHLTNLGALLIVLAASLTIGLPAFLLIWLPAAVLSASAGTWLFFVQHQFEDAYWQPQESWNFDDAALAGSSYYRLPRILQWFTGNIGFHHIHHLNSRIPNYNLQACYEAESAFREGATFGIWESLRCASFKLWDDDEQRMVGFAEARAKG